ncbi:MAG: helix-turn-helix transcriptional regulator [Alicyclobacillus sp.]|nr:helix-turn-helix transcriptional regulator [Alicyclobacillus sp.]
MDKHPNVECKLKEILAEYGSRMTWLSQKSGVPYASLYRFVSGERMPDVDVAIAIARALGKRVEDIWVWKEVKEGE